MLYPHVGKEHKNLTLKEASLFKEAADTWPNHLLKALLLNTTTMTTSDFWKGYIHTIAEFLALTFSTVSGFQNRYKPQEHKKK
jgi:hypothetical protein